MTAAWLFVAAMIQRPPVAPAPTCETRPWDCCEECERREYLASLVTTFDITYATACMIFRCGPGATLDRDLCECVYEPGRCPVCGSTGVELGLVDVDEFPSGEAVGTVGTYRQPQIRAWRCPTDGLLFTAPERP